MNGFDLIIVPDPEEAEAAELYVEGTVGGKPYRFLLDTGAARSRVEWDDYTAPFTSAEKNDSSGVFARSSEDIITVPDITVGPIAKKNFTLVRLGEPSSGRGNLIGMDLLKDFSCHFLFDENRVLVDEHDATSLLQNLYLGPSFIRMWMLSSSPPTPMRYGIPGPALPLPIEFCRQHRLLSGSGAVVGHGFNREPQWIHRCMS